MLYMSRINSTEAIGLFNIWLKDINFANLRFKIHTGGNYALNYSIHWFVLFFYAFDVIIIPHLQLDGKVT